MSEKSRIEEMAQQLKELREEVAQLKDGDQEADTEVLKNDPSVRSYEMGNVLMAASLKIPRLIAMDKEAIRNFMKNYEEYEVLAPAELVREPQLLVRMDVLEVVAEQNTETVKELMKATVPDFWVKLCRLHGSYTLWDLEARFRTLSMKTDDLAASTLATYHNDWKFEELLAGGKVTIPEKHKAKIYVDGLRPSQLREMVRQYEPRTVVKAMESVRSIIGDLRIGREQAKMFQGGKGAETLSPNRPYNAYGQGKVRPVTTNGRTGGPANGGERPYNLQGATAGGKTDKKSDKSKAHILCYNCQQKGHYANECTAAKVERVFQGSQGSQVPKVSMLPGKPVTKRMVQLETETCKR